MRPVSLNEIYVALDWKLVLSLDTCIIISMLSVYADYCLLCMIYRTH